MPEFRIQDLIDDINHSLSPEKFDAAASRSLAAFDVLSWKIIEQKRVKLDCREGCALCCSLRVDVLAHEVFLIARHIRSNFTTDEISNLLSRLAARSEMVLPLTPFEHATMNVRCPLLHDERCSVYAVRPHSCRRHHSQDFTMCQFTFDHPTDLESPAAHNRDLFRGLTEAMRQNFEAYADLAFDPTIYEVGTALNEALNNPAGWQRWRDYEQAFIHASITPAA